MRQIKLFIATTLDGFIARPNGALDWLHEIPNPRGLDYGYNDFLNSVDVIVMGRKTYEEILAFGVDWPYDKSKTYIITKDASYITKTANTCIHNSIDESTIELFKTNTAKNIWVVGGGEIITAFLNLHAISEVTLSIIPILLGEGIRLFGDGLNETSLELLKTEPFDTGIVNLTYKIKTQ